MAVDYTQSAATATRLISENGRAITLSQSSDTPSNPARPWGPKAATGGSSISTIGVFVNLERDGQTDIHTKRQRVLVPADASLPEEVGPEWQVTDLASGQVYEVFSSKPLKPGGTVVFYALEVSL